MGPNKVQLHAPIMIFKRSEPIPSFEPNLLLFLPGPFFDKATPRSGCVCVCVLCVLFLIRAELPGSLGKGGKASQGRQLGQVPEAMARS